MARLSTKQIDRSGLGPAWADKAATRRVPNAVRRAAARPEGLAGTVPRILGWIGRGSGDLERVRRAASNVLDVAGEPGQGLSSLTGLGRGSGGPGGRSTVGPSQSGPAPGRWAETQSRRSQRQPGRRLQARI